jgi:hypothetical protein
LKDKPQAIADIIECLAVFTSWIQPRAGADLSFHLPRIIEALKGKGLHSPLGGWAEVTGRFLAALDVLEVQTRSSTSVKKLLLDKSGMARGARLHGNIKVEADGVILAMPLKPCEQVLEASRLEVELPQAQNLTVTVWDLLLEQKAFNGVHALWDAERKVALFVCSEVVPERIPEQLRDSHTHLQILSYDGAGPIEELLDERCAGWSSHISQQRRLKGLVISQAGEVFEGRPGMYFEQPLLDRGVAFAGEWMANEHWLAEGAFQSGIIAAQELHDVIKG